MRKKVLIVAGLALAIGYGVIGCGGSSSGSSASGGSRGSLGGQSGGGSNSISVVGGLPADARAICGNSRILGRAENRISNGACGIDNPVRVYAVGGIKLENSALINCTTARALENWVETSAKPSAARINKQLSSMRVAASYACRNRNHKKGGRLSEHAKGNAVDISAFTFTDGSTLTVQNAYNQYRSYFSNVRRQACGPFGTVLGPGVALHGDHFHFDVARYPGGPYCK